MRPGPPTLPDEPPVTWPQAVVTFATTVGLFLVGGSVCAVVWAAVVEPPTYPASLPRLAGEPIPDGRGLRRTFNVDATFLLVALAGSFALGLVCAVLFRRHGVVTVLSVLAGSGAAYLTMRHLGFGLGPETLAAQAAQARGAGADASLLAPLRVQATGVYFAWPIGALAGAMAALWALAPRPPAPGYAGHGAGYGVGYGVGYGAGYGGWTEATRREPPQV